MLIHTYCINRIAGVFIRLCTTSSSYLVARMVISFGGWCCCFCAKRFTSTLRPKVPLSLYCWWYFTVSSYNIQPIGGHMRCWKGIAITDRKCTRHLVSNADRLGDRADAMDQGNKLQGYFGICWAGFTFASDASQHVGDGGSFYGWWRSHGTM